MRRGTNRAGTDGVILAGLILVSGAGWSFAGATKYDWNGGSGDWINGANWHRDSGAAEDPGEPPPGTTDSARFNVSGPYTVQLPAGTVTEIDYIEVSGANNVTLNIPANATLKRADTSLTREIWSGGSLTQTGGGKQQWGYIWQPAGGVSIVLDGSVMESINSGSIYQRGGHMTLVVTNGSTIANTTGQARFCGAESGASATIHVHGSTWNHSGQDFMAGEALNTTFNMTVSGGSTVTSSRLRLNYGSAIAGASASLLLTGTGTMWTTSSSIEIGRNNKPDGLATLTIADGAVLRNDSSGSLSMFTNSLVVLNGGIYETAGSSGYPYLYPGSRLEGSGTLRPYSGTMSLRLDGGTIVVGGSNSIGTITTSSHFYFNVHGNPSRMEFELESLASYDQFITARGGEMDKDGNSNCEMTAVVTVLPGYVPEVGDTYDLLTDLDLDDAFTSTDLPTLDLVNGNPDEISSLSGSLAFVNDNRTLRLTVTAVEPFRPVRPVSGTIFSAM